MIKSVVYEIGYTPKEIDELYCDGDDHYSIVYWHDFCIEISEKSNLKKKN